MQDRVLLLLPSNMSILDDIIHKSESKCIQVPLRWRRMQSFHGSIRFDRWILGLLQNQYNFHLIFNISLYMCHKIHHNNRNLIHNQLIEDLLCTAQFAIPCVSSDLLGNAWNIKCVF